MPIPLEQKIIAIAFSLVLFAVILQLIRKHKLREEYALIWFAVSLVIVLFSLFDGILSYLAGLLAVVYAPTLVLVFGILFCVILLLAQTVMLSNQANRLRDLAQTIGLLEWRLHQLEERRSDGSPQRLMRQNGQHSAAPFALEESNESTSMS
ncbi:MAG: DUF2304 domain-containing protein [Caldilineaceae bacterium]